MDLAVVDVLIQHMRLALTAPNVSRTAAKRDKPNTAANASAFSLMP